MIQHSILENLFVGLYGYISLLFSFVPADYLASRCQASLDCMDRLPSAIETFLADNTGSNTSVVRTIKIIMPYTIIPVYMVYAMPKLGPAKMRNH